MKTFISLLALLLSLSITAQTNPATWYLNDTSGSGIQSPTNTASGNSSVAMGENSIASGLYSLGFGVQTNASGYAAIAMGRASTASGESATSIGHQTTASGNFSIAMGENSTASELYSMSFGVQTDASAYAALAMGRATSASGNSSVSLNYLTSASGYASLAVGSSTQSIGENSFAGGLSTQSTGYSSAALGRETVASGNHSLSIGQGTNSHAFNSVALGQYNSVSNNADPDTYLTTNTALVVGNGTDTNNRSNAFKVLFDGTTTIAGSVTASSFIGDGSGLTGLPLVIESITEGGNTGVRLSSANAANHGDIGNTAVDLSYQSSASSTTGAKGDYSTALGSETTASGYYSTATGYSTTASGETATATGQFTSASGKFSLSSGLYSNASGTTSVALGNNTIADGYGTLATGYFNTANANPQADSFDQSNTAFVIGNGTFENRSNAFKVLFDGTTTIAGDLSINSDARLKANIVSLGATLSKLLKIDGKSYTMKKDESKKQKIGLLAQDIEKVFPELVSESNGIKSINYQGLVPVLINALKEQDVLMKEQQRILSEHQSELDGLKSIMKKIIERQ
jgi:hypothetical protein